MNQEQWKGISRDGFMEQIAEKLPDDRIYLKYPSLTGRAEIPEDRQIQAAGDIYTESPGFEGESLYGKVSFYDEGVLPLIKEYLIAGTVDGDSMANENGVILVVNGIAQDTVTKIGQDDLIENIRMG